MWPVCLGTSIWHDNENIDGDCNMIKTIKYLPKNTAAKTEYRQIADDDRAEILATCVRILAEMSRYDTLRDQDSRWVREQWWHRRTDQLHRGENGQNTPCSVIGGVVFNMLYKEPRQRDLSAKQMDDLTQITAILAQVNDQIPALRFQIGIE